MTLDKERECKEDKKTEKMQKKLREIDDEDKAGERDREAKWDRNEMLRSNPPERKADTVKQFWILVWWIE